MPADAAHEDATRDRLAQPKYRLDAARREVVLHTILKVARHRGWSVWAIHVRTNHVHVIVTAGASPEKVMSDFKAWASRRLREAFAEHVDRNRWTQHGSTRYLWTETTLADKIAYVVDGQGDAMSVYDSRRSGADVDTEPDA